MKQFLSGLCAAALVAVTGVSTAVPAAAQSRFQYEAMQNAPAWQQRRVDRQMQRGLDRAIGREMRRDARREWRHDRRDFRRADRNNFRRGYYHDGRYGWYNGHRGYHRYRRGYREHNGFWFPLAAFAAGAVISGAISNSQPVYRDYGDAHVAWCYDRYRSYREYDNTFQPYEGPRQQCYSPYS